MDVIAAYRDVGSYRGAAEICGTTHKTVRRIIEAHEAGQRPVRKGRARNFDQVRDLVAQRVEKTSGRISAKRLLPQARAAGYAGSARNFRRLVAQVKAEWRQGHHRGRRPGVWAPGETLIIDWGVEAGLHVFCAVSAWSRFRFVRFAADEKAATTFALLAECFETLGGVPKHGAGRPDGLPEIWGGRERGGADPGLCPVRHPLRVSARFLRGGGSGVEGHGGASGRLCQAGPDGPAGSPSMISPRPMTAAAVWCAEVNAVTHSEICAVPVDRLAVEQPLFRPLPSLRLEFGVPAGRPGRSTGCRVSGSGRPATRCRAG